MSEHKHTWGPFLGHYVQCTDPECCAIGSTMVPGNEGNITLCICQDPNCNEVAVSVTSGFQHCAEHKPIPGIDLSGIGSPS